MNKKILSLHVDVDKLVPATEEEKEYIVKMRPSSTFFKDGAKRFLKNKVATISLIVVILITLTSIFLPMFWPYSYEQQLGIEPGKAVDSTYNNLAPFEYGATEQAKIAAGEKVFPHIFGTDAQGRDYFIRVVYGTRISLGVGFFASLIVLLIGLTIGSVAGYFGGKMLFKQIHTHAVTVTRNSRKFKVLCAESIECTDKARLFADYSLSLVGKNFRCKFNTLLTTGNNDNIIKIAANIILFRNTLGSCATQRCITLGNTVLECSTGFAVKY
ncbi:MAG: hypothetical protein IKV21_02380, partial [Clostridia bacterium]|nr:hypothetical protein [Clostridia bacterium]